jgi:hypothetical protein
MCATDSQYSQSLIIHQNLADKARFGHISRSLKATLCKICGDFFVQTQFELLRKGKYSCFQWVPVFWSQRYVTETATHTTSFM